MLKRIYVIYPRSSTFVVERMQHAEPVIPERQYETAEEAWVHRDERRIACDLPTSRDDEVAIALISTGERNARGVELFAPDWTVEP